MRPHAWITLALAGLLLASPLRAEEEESPIAKANKALTQAQKDRNLLWGAMGGNLPQVQAALAAGANIRVKDDHGRTALDYALYFGHEPLFMYLYERSAPLWTDAPVYPLDPDQPVSPIFTSLFQAQIERNAVKLGSAVNHAEGVGAAWPFYDMPERTNVPGGPPKSPSPATPAEAPKEPVAPAESSMKSPEAPAAPAAKLANTCLGLDEAGVEKLKTWCEAVKFKVRPACVAAGCGGNFEISDNKIRCTTCKTADGTATGALFVVGGDVQSWDLASSGQPVAPHTELLGLVNLCGLIADTGVTCEKKAELAGQILKAAP